MLITTGVVMAMGDDFDDHFDGDHDDNRNRDSVMMILRTHVLRTQYALRLGRPYNHCD